jgi:hypothetical protein
MDMSNTRMRPAVGLLLSRRRDGALATVVAVELCVPSVSRPGVYGKTLVTVRYLDPAVAQAVGGDAAGDLAWFRSHFTTKGVS